MTMTMSADMGFAHHAPRSPHTPQTPHTPLSHSEARTQEYTNQNGKPVRVVRYVHYIQAPPGGIESMSQEQQQQLMAEARASIAQRTAAQASAGHIPASSPPPTAQQHGYSAPAALRPRGAPQPLDYNSIHPEAANTPIAPQHVPSSYLGVPHATHAVWPAGPQAPEAQQRPTVGATVMLSGREPWGKYALRAGEAGRIVEDDGSMMPYAVEGPRGDIDWYGEDEVCVVAERPMCDNRQLLGDQLYSRIAMFTPATAAKVVGMFLDAMDENELCGLLYDPIALRHRVAQAHQALHSAYPAPPTPQTPQPQYHCDMYYDAPQDNHCMTSPLKLPPSQHHALQPLAMHCGASTTDNSCDTAPATPYTEASSLVMDTTPSPTHTSRHTPTQWNSAPRSHGDESLAI